MTWWDDLEAQPDDDTVPRFFVQPPDGRRDWPEIARQETLFSLMVYAAPKVYGFPIPNAGRRNPQRARRECIKAGVFDTAWHFHKLTAYVELKGYDKNGRPGTLSRDQIRFGNRMVDFGIPCACFFSPHGAANWLREQGFPVREVRAA